MADRDFRVDLDGPRVTVDGFVRAVEGLLTVLREVDRAVSGRPGGSMRFVITDLQKASAHLSAVAEPTSELPADDEIDRIIRIAAEGLISLQERPERPPFFTDKAIEGARAITKTVRRGYVTSIRLGVGGRNVVVTPELGAHAQQLMLGQLRSLGTLEGRLEVLNVHQGSRFVIYDRVTGRAIRCFFPETELPFVMSAFGRRVAVSGVIWSNSMGDPVSVEVQSGGDILVFPRDEDLPRAWDVKGLLK